MDAMHEFPIDGCVQEMMSKRLQHIKQTAKQQQTKQPVASARVISPPPLEELNQRRL